MITTIRKSNIKKVGMYMTIVSFILYIPIVYFLGVTTSTYTMIWMVVGLVVHEFGHFIFINLYKIKWKPFLKIYAVGYDPVGGMISWRQWLMVSGSGFLFTIPFVFIDFYAFLILAIGATGDLAFTLMFAKHSPRFISFTPKNILMIK